MAQHSRNSLPCFSRQRSSYQRVDCLMDDPLLDILGIWGRYITTQIQCTFMVACSGLVPEASPGPQKFIILNILNNRTRLFISINRKIYFFSLNRPWVFVMLGFQKIVVTYLKTKKKALPLSSNIRKGWVSEVKLNLLII